MRVSASPSYPVSLVGFLTFRDLPQMTDLGKWKIRQVYHALMVYIVCFIHTHAISTTDLFMLLIYVGTGNVKLFCIYTAFQDHAFYSQCKSVLGQSQKKQLWMIKLACKGYY